MRHRKKFNHLGRKKAHRELMLANMACSLIEHKRIKTTTAKAKALKMYIEPLITKAKKDETHSRRVVFRYLRNKTAVGLLFREIAEKVGDRPGGYTRILKLGNRFGDNAEMCFIELVDYNENMLKETKAKKSRSRRSKKKSVTAETEETAVVEEVVEAQEQPEEVQTELQETGDAKAEAEKAAEVPEVAVEETVVKEPVAAEEDKTLEEADEDVEEKTQDAPEAKVEEEVKEEAPQKEVNTDEEEKKAE